MCQTSMLAPGPTGDLPPNKQDNECPEDCDQEAPKIETRYAAEAESRPDRAAQDCSHDPDHHGDDESDEASAAGVVSRHNQLRDGTGEEAKDYPGDDSHFELLSICWIEHTHGSTRRHRNQWFRRSKLIPVALSVPR